MVVHMKGIVVILSGIVLIAKFCINIAFLSAICILATSLHHCTQNDRLNKLWLTGVRCITQH